LADDKQRLPMLPSVAAGDRVTGLPPYADEQGSNWEKKIVWERRQDGSPHGSIFAQSRSDGDYRLAFRPALY
jgi:hypothetical protein